MILKPSASLETSVQSEALPNLVKILNKLDHSRSNEERDRIVKALEKTNYFKDFICNPEKRSEFIQSMAYHVEYKYFPKGAAVCHQGDFDARFGIIINGRAIVYTPKTMEEQDGDMRYRNTRECYAIYRKFLDSNDFTKKFKRWAQMGFQNAENKLLLTLKKIVKKQAKPVEAPSHGLNQLDIRKLMTTVLDESDSIIPSDKKHQDLSFEDKLLLLNCNSNNEKYFKNGISLYKKSRELRGGDCIAENALTMDMIIEDTVIATHDLHIITLKQQHFRELFQKSGYFQEKKEFLATVFPALSQEALFQLCAYTNEKLVVNRDYIYKQGEPAEALYIIRSGEVELVTYDGGEEDIEKVPNSFILKTEPKKKFQTKYRVIAGALKAGSVFGEDEVIMEVTRKYSAVSRSASLIVYTLKRQVYYDIFEKYMPYFSDIFKSIMKTKQEWRQERVSKEQIIVTQLNRKRDLSADNKNPKMQRAIRNTPIFAESEYFQFEPTRPEVPVPKPLSRSIVKLERKTSRTVRQKVEIKVYSNERRQASINSQEETSTSRLMLANMSLSQKFLRAKKNLHRVHRSIAGTSEIMQTSRSKEQKTPKVTTIPILSRNEINEKINSYSPNQMIQSGVFNFETKKSREEFLAMNLKQSESVREKKGPLIPSINKLKAMNASTFLRNHLTSENNDSILIPTTTRENDSRGSIKNSLDNSIDNIKEEQIEVKTREKSYHLYKRILANKPKKRNLTVTDGFLVHDSRSFSIKSLNKL